MSKLVRKMRREQDRAELHKREMWRERRHQMARYPNHICKPAFRGKPHAFAYCAICGTVMSAHPQP
jgi:hypothetical protein